MFLEKLRTNVKTTVKADIEAVDAFLSSIDSTFIRSGFCC